MTAPALTGRPTAAPAPLDAPPDTAPDASPRALLWRSLRARRRDLALASLFFSSHQLGEALVPVIVGAAVGNAVQDGTPRQLAGWLGLLAADFLLLSLSYRFGARAAKRAAQHTEHQVRGLLTGAVLRPTGGVRLLPGDLLSRAAGDAERVGAYARTLASTVAAVVVLLAAALLLVRISPPLGALVVAGTAGLLAAQHRLSATLRRTSAAEQAHQAGAAALAEDLIRGLRVLKGIGAERTVAADYARVSQDAVRAARRAASTEAALLSLGTAFTGLYLTAVAAVGGRLALDGRLGLDEFIAALGLAQFVIGPMRVVAAARAGHARALASAARLHEVLVTPPAVTDPGETTGAPGADGRRRVPSDAGEAVTNRLGTDAVVVRSGGGDGGVAEGGAGGGDTGVAEGPGRGDAGASERGPGGGDASASERGAGGGDGGVAEGGPGGGDASASERGPGGGDTGVAEGPGRGDAPASERGPGSGGASVAEGGAGGGDAVAAERGPGREAAGPPGSDGGTTVLGRGDLEFRGVRLPDGSVLDARVPGGAMTGLVCDAPAVAEAVTALLAREFDPAEGAVLLGGTDLAALPLETLRATALVCPHEPALLPGTLADNLGALADGDAATAEGARAALADQVVNAAPHGAGTSVGDRGETLSGGQRQRVALARALAARSPVLVLHDPTTAVDAATEHTIADRVRRTRAGRTTLVITNSPTWLARCGRVVHLHGTQGAARCDTGTHTALLAESPAYRRTVTR
ncbi:ABC transporter ATP-binding protein [Streptomyces sp. MAA16]|uniref:ABC transporter ATP-binding protein n=1 Tax=Streptomyces sp. MAA16 TaxID=3035116 RepID=UPI002474A61F|nr:ABC transporter ATP-binding protein [Streptomyces sp. MAA16]MDH6699468.1 putative ABC transport system ATP-binding protein [Streptomyces sp. MAA16]